MLVADLPVSVQPRIVSPPLGYLLALVQCCHHGWNRDCFVGTNTALTFEFHIPLPVGAPHNGIEAVLVPRLMAVLVERGPVQFHAHLLFHLGPSVDGIHRTQSKRYLRCLRHVIGSSPLQLVDADFWLDRRVR